MTTMNLTEQELKAIEREAEEAATDSGYINSTTGRQFITHGYIKGATQERIKAKKLLDGLKQISESKFASYRIQVFAKALVSEYNTKQIEP